MPRTDKAVRDVAAAPERVYAALVDPDALVEWLPPEGMTGSFERFAARPGGSYRMTLSYSDPVGTPGKTDDGTDVVEARFIELVPHDHVTQAVEFVSDDPAFAGTMTMVWHLTAIDAGTRVEFRAHDVPDGVSAEDHAAGLASSLANLARHLER